MVWRSASGQRSPRRNIYTGLPCHAATAGEPAMTIIPNFLLTGILAIIMGIIVTIWSAAYIERKNGGLILILLSIIMLLFGGGIPSHNWSNKWNHWHKN